MEDKIDLPERCHPMTGIWYKRPDKDCDHSFERDIHWDDEKCFHWRCTKCRGIRCYELFE